MGGTKVNAVVIPLAAAAAITTTTTVPTLSTMMCVFTGLWACGEGQTWSYRLRFLVDQND